MALVTYNKKDKQYGFAQQAAFGTAVIDSGAIQEIDCEDTVMVADVKYREAVGSHGTRNMTYDDIIVDEKGAMPGISFTMEAKQDEIDFFLHGFFQKVTEDASTPFKKTFELPVTQPDLSIISAITDPGQLLTIVERFPEASTSAKIADAICKSLTFTLSPGGRLMMGSEWVGRGKTELDADPSGTWTREDPAYYFFEDLAVVTIDFGGGAQPVVPTGDIVIGLECEVKGVGADGSGNFQTLHTQFNRALTFSIVLNRDAQVAAAKVNWLAGTPIAVRVGFGNSTPGTDDGDLDFAYTAIIEKVEEDNEDVLGTILSGKIVAPNATSEPITIIIANEEDRTWT